MKNFCWNTFGKQSSFSLITCTAEKIVKEIHIKVQVLVQCPVFDSMIFIGRSSAIEYAPIQPRYLRLLDFLTITPLQASGVIPHSKSVFIVTGQDRPRPLFPASQVTKGISQINHFRLIMCTYIMKTLKIDKSFNIVILNIKSNKKVLITINFFSLLRFLVCLLPFIGGGMQSTELRFKNLIFFTN